MISFAQECGAPFPMGATKISNGWNFAVYSESPVEALIIAPFLNPSKTQELPLDPSCNKTGSIWHISIKTDERALYYGFYVEFQGKRVLLSDPYAKLMHTGHNFGENSFSTKKYLIQPIGLAVDEPPFDWGHDKPLCLESKELVIYEMHIRGFTGHSSSKVEQPGTFSGAIKKIPYLKELGINAVEFLPIMEFDETENHNVNPKTKKKLFNFWGYSTLSFFSPMQRFGSSDDPIENRRECKKMIKAFHEAGIEVLLDVVFNHTGEGNELGPTISWKGFAESTYYLKNGQNHYLNYSGCGNTLNCNHPVVADMIIEALRYWVIEFHVDGFRFDLASILTRGQSGESLETAPLIERISQDPILSHCKLIAEPWDAAGLHHVGSFYQIPWKAPEQWMEWNDDFRTIVRRFLKGSPGYVGRFATKLCGSEDYYKYNGSPLNSINYVTCHDGFTLQDLVSYNEKHNEENGEQNYDGMNNNDSWNCGQEGPTSESHIEMLRERQMKNFWLALFVSAGIPMILMGDEYGHTKNGNNNTWCHNDEKNWFLWNELEGSSSHVRFCKEMIHFRNNNPLLKRCSFYRKEDIVWHGAEPFRSDWSAQSQFLAYTIKDHENGNDLYIAFNAHPDPCHVILPPPNPNKKWMLVVNTAHLPPGDIIDETMIHKPVVDKMVLAPYSAVMLHAHAHD